MFPEGRSSLYRARFPDFEVVVAGSSTRKVDSGKKVKLVAVPLLPIYAGTRGETGDQHTNLDQISAEEMIAAPSTWCPNPAETSCLVVKGASMSPMIENGDVVAVDYSQTDPGSLSGKIVVAWHREHGLSLARFFLVKGVQMLDSGNRKYQPLVLEKDRNWRIIGRVLGGFERVPEVGQPLICPMHTKDQSRNTNLRIERLASNQGGNRLRDLSCLRSAN